MGCGLSNMGTNKVCIETKKVFDVCIRRLQLTNVSLPVVYTDAPSFPVTVQSIVNSGASTVTNVTVSPVLGSLYSVVNYTLTIPISVTVADTAGNVFVGTSTLSLAQSVRLRFPDDGALVPTEFEASAILTGFGLSATETTVTANLCVLIINKVVAEVILAVPTFGYPKLKICAENGNFCTGFEDRSIFPTI